MSRSAILQAIRAAQPAALPMPSLQPLLEQSSPARLEDFTAMLDFIGAGWEKAASLAEVEARLRENLPHGARIASTVPGMVGDTDLAAISDPHALDGIHTAVLPGRFGVCENGAIWLDEAALGPHRVLPFIAEHLAIVLHSSQLEGTMHAAYARLGTLQDGFGLFLAGPSKTADIEQCLVIGAHGARSCRVWLLEG